MAAPTVEQFEDLEQQFESDTLGMWTFMVTEIMFFGGLFLGYTVYRVTYPEAWMEGSHHMNLWAGTINTGVLLLSSLLMALGVHAAEDNHRKLTVRYLAATVALAVVFLGIKAYEYYHHITDNLFPGPEFSFEGMQSGPHELFFGFYFTMTGLHALHVLIGIGVIGAMAIQVSRDRLSTHMPIELTGLYWHFVDVVWVFLYPLFYLIR